MVSHSVLSFRAAIKRKRRQRIQDFKGHWFPYLSVGMEIRLRAGQSSNSGSDSSCLSQRNNGSRTSVFPGIKNLILEIIRTVPYRRAWHEEGDRTHTLWSDTKKIVETPNMKPRDFYQQISTTNSG